MPHKTKFLSLLFAPILLFCFLVSEADAATMSVIPERRTLNVGDVITIDVVINTNGDSINAAQGTIRFPSSLFEATAISKTGSVFDFWIEEPSVSNETGTARFIGGTPKGVSGSSLFVARLTLKAIGEGAADIVLNDAAITASDGQGTNILTGLFGTSLAVGAGAAAPPPVVIPPAPEPAPISTPTPSAPATPPPTPQRLPEPVVRPAVRAAERPVAPTVEVPLYPDQEQWYNHIGEVIALWNVPDDIIDVAVERDQNPNTVPQDVEPVLVNGKNFGKMEQGIHFVHVQFRNNRGWGETTHYKMSVDVDPPVEFEAKIESLISDNPTPRVTFETFDALSGFSHVVLAVDGQEVLRTTGTAVALPVQSPGEHVLLVTVFDHAGNSVEDDLTFEILPLPTPSIEFISRSVAGDEFPYASGKTVPDGTVELVVFNASQQEVFQGTVQSDGGGSWGMTINESLPPGRYQLAARVSDMRGAISFFTGMESFRIRPKTVISIGPFIDLGWFEVLLFIILSLVAAGSLVAWKLTQRRRTRQAYQTIAKRDINAFSDQLMKNIEELEQSVASLKKGLPAKAQTDMKQHISSLQSVVKRMRKYLGEEVSR